MTPRPNFNETFQASVIQLPGDELNQTIRFASKRYFLNKMSQLPLGQKVWVTIDARKQKRSEQQNNLYWLYLSDIAEEHGGDAYGLHQNFKEDFGVYEVKRCPRWVEDEEGGWVKTEVDVKVPKSTSKYTKDEFAMYLLKIEEATGVPIPDTNKYLYGDIQETMRKMEENYPDEEVDPNQIPF